LTTAQPQLSKPPGSTINTQIMASLFAALALLGCFGLVTAASGPNFVLIMTDDQDLHLGSLDYQPKVWKHFGEKGTFFKKHYCTMAVCCPSRVSFLTGKAGHNTNVTDVRPPYGVYLPLRRFIMLSNQFLTICRWVSKIRRTGPQRQLPSGVATGSWLQHLLHW